METQEDLMKGVIPGDDTPLYNADGEKSVEQKRTEILEKRINLLNDFFVAEQETGATFGDFLQSKGITKEHFLSELPENYRFGDVDKITLSNQEMLDTLIEYIYDLNVLNSEQYESFDDRKADENKSDRTAYLNAYGDDYNDADGDEWHEAKGKRKAKREARKEAQKAAGGLKGKDARAAKKAERKRAKEERKRAREEKKRIKKQLKADVKSGKISKKDKRNAMKDARKDFRKKAGGSFVGRAGRKFRKFDPGMALTRNSFNSLLRINFANFAYNLGRMMDENGSHWKKVEKIWRNFGGEIFSLKNNIKLGRVKKPVLGKKKYDASGDDGIFFNAVVPAVPAVAASAWVAAATAALGATGAVISAFKKDKGEPMTAEDDPGDLPDDTNPDGDVIDEENKKVIAGTDVEDGDDEDGEGIMAALNKYKWWIVGGFVVLAVGGILISMGKK